jgi:ABC-type xylose transport system permease subunit
MSGTKTTRGSVVLVTNGYDAACDVVSELLTASSATIPNIADTLQPAVRMRATAARWPGRRGAAVREVVRAAPSCPESGRSVIALVVVLVLVVVVTRERAVVLAVLAVLGLGLVVVSRRRRRVGRNRLRRGL